MLRLYLLHMTLLFYIIYVLFIMSVCVWVFVFNVNVGAFFHVWSLWKGVDISTWYMGATRGGMAAQVRILNVPHSSYGDVSFIILSIRYIRVARRHTGRVYSHTQPKALRFFSPPPKMCFKCPSSMLYIWNLMIFSLFFSLFAHTILCFCHAHIKPTPEILKNIVQCV